MTLRRSLLSLALLLSSSAWAIARDKTPPPDVDDDRRGRMKIEVEIEGGDDAREGWGEPPPREPSAPAPAPAPSPDPEQAGLRVHFTGTRFIPERDLYELAGLRPGESIDARALSAALRRLERTNLFLSGTPRERDGEVEIALVEYPVVRGVELRGATDNRPSELLEELFPDVDGEPALVRASARSTHGRFAPGIARGGLEARLRRLLEGLHEEGYALATLTAELTPDGELAIDLDEGRVAMIAVEGPTDGLADRVREAAGLRAGDLVLESDLERAVEKVAAKFPTLRPVEAGRHARAKLYLDATRTRDGAVRYRGGVSGEQAGDGYVLRGTTLVFRFRGAEAPRSQVRWDASELFRHTQVTSFAPGLALNIVIYEPEDRARLIFDGGFNVNLGQGVRRAVDGFGGLRVMIPWLSSLELGGQIHRLTDTQDRWRTSSIDSYLSSMFFNAPESEYFRRDGFALLGAVRVSDHLQLGAEYRRDLYASLDSLPKVWSVFHGARYGYFNPAIDDGRMASMLVRLEYSSDAPSKGLPIPLSERYAEVFLDWRNHDRDRNSLNSLNTVEVASRQLGTSDTEFVKLVSDSRAFLTTGHDQGLRLRFRAAGGNDLPLQKQESLGGWSALRGYDFKEFRGDISLLGTAEYDWHCLSVFADLGSVKQAAGWIEPRLSLGAALNLGDRFRVAAAWRTDDRAKATPSFHAVFNQPF